MSCTRGQRVVMCLVRYLRRNSSEETRIGFRRSTSPNRIAQATRSNDVQPVIRKQSDRNCGCCFGPCGYRLLD